MELKKISIKFEYFGIGCTYSSQISHSSSHTSLLCSHIIFIVKDYVEREAECFRMQVFPIQGVEKVLSHWVTAVHRGSRGLRSPALMSHKVTLFILLRLDSKIRIWAA
jgi:hypothetical protein